MYGAVCAVGTPVVRTDAAVIWAGGTFWWEVPPIAKLVLSGKLPPGSTGKDVIITLCGLYNNDEVLNHAIEFTGDGVATLTMEERMAISNMTTEWGALVGMFPFDDVCLAFIRERPRVTDAEIEKIRDLDLSPDPGARYAKTLYLDLGKVTPHVSGPNEVKVMAPVADLEEKKIRIQKAYLVSCVNSRLQDIAAAAGVLEGRKVAEGVEFYVAAASSIVEKAAREKGYWQTLEQAGAKFLPPGCGPCIGLGAGLLEAGEVGISATNRNFKGRMGSKDSLCYLASPAVVAASACAGHIANAVPAGNGRPEPRVEVHEREEQAGPEVQIISGFPNRISGEALFLPKDNMNTDGIYGKDYTYKDDMKPEEMARVAFLNYDEKFQDLAKEGDILVGGRNFGTGSSREQAATALKYRGIRLVVAESFSQTYKRNAFNNGFICIECPRLVQALRKEFSGRKELTLRTGWEVTVDFVNGKIQSPAGTFPFAPLGEVPQELVVAGGAEARAREALAH
jgi:homoaconitate hydratase